MVGAFLMLIYQEGSDFYGYVRYYCENGVPEGIEAISCRRSVYGYEILQKRTLCLCSKFLHNCGEIEHTKS